MLDQSFSFENFRIILDVENRKGNYIEDMEFFNTDIFKDSREISDKIILINKEIWKETKKLKLITVKNDGDYDSLNKLYTKKEELIKKREGVLKNILQRISTNANHKNYKLTIQKGQVKFGSQLYIIDDKPEDYLVSKQLQRNIFKTFKVKQASRKSIISQLKLLLDDGFPKVIIRTDISKFYESIPHNKLLSIIEENSLLSYPSKKIIRDILNKYWGILISDGVKMLNDERVGIPRGIGFSAFLSELYLRSFDRRVKSLPNVTFYARYVDDIFIIVTPSNRNESRKISSYKIEIKNILKETTRLDINLMKTSVTDLRRTNVDRNKSQKYFITYLGYKFKISYQSKVGEDGKKSIYRDPVKILMSDAKLERYETKLETAFADYNANIIKYNGSTNGTNKLLLSRIKFLTTNFQLLRRKSNVFIGVFFSNEFLSEPLEDLKKLDVLLRDNILRISPHANINLITALKNLTFENGFLTKVIVQFNTESFRNGKIWKIWKNL